MSCFVAFTKLMKKNIRGPIKTYDFHFKGSFHGEIIKGIKIEGNKILECHIGDEYLLYLEFLRINEGYLYGKLIKMKEINDVTH